ncbi:unnamed protein product [Tetraodon nigroviridis]|uniref:Chromosome undetermined SCAF2461, whole genome shotgun sequence n=1 Tax=Tetraodon nigroviridis TaxID=99883 RepID=Q4TI20_TETNG|nr:unnamed protein product [Tetraodon nigroviridis]
MGNTGKKMVREEPFNEQQSIKREMKRIQEEHKELLRSKTELQHQVSQLKEQLAEKEEQMSRIIQKHRRTTVAHVEAMNLLTSTQAELKESKQRCAAEENCGNSRRRGASRRSTNCGRNSSSCRFPMVKIGRGNSRRRGDGRRSTNCGRNSSSCR